MLDGQAQDVDLTMRPGKRDVVAILYAESREDFVSAAPAGAFRWTGLYGVEGDRFGMNFKCPCGCGAVHGVGFDNRPTDWVAQDRPRPQWNWDDNEEKPTLTPSLGLHKSRDDQTVGADGYHWHGFLKAGVFEEC